VYIFFNISGTYRVVGDETNQNLSWHREMNSKQYVVFYNLRRNIMKKLYLGIQRFMNDEAGVTAIEYGLIASLIAIVIGVAVATVGNELKVTFNKITTCLGNSAACT
jgi:pilus assembly protein Flp/PilA